MKHASRRTTLFIVAALAAFQWTGSGDATELVARYHETIADEVLGDTPGTTTVLHIGNTALEMERQKFDAFRAANIFKVYTAEEVNKLLVDSKAEDQRKMDNLNHQLGDMASKLDALGRRLDDASGKK